MSEKPIIFSTKMIRAILDGRKTQTRRVINPQPILDRHLWMLVGAGWSDTITSFHPVPCHSLYNRMPYKPGDILWVRETWAEDPMIKYLYKADYGLIYKYQNWRPSIFMPRAAARIFLRVTDVRVERLQDISEADARREGCEVTIRNTVINGTLYNGSTTASQEFLTLWDGINGKRDGGAYKWDMNPWVWVIEFERIGEQGE